MNELKVGRVCQSVWQVTRRTKVQLFGRNMSSKSMVSACTVPGSQRKLRQHYQSLMLIFARCLFMHVNVAIRTRCLIDKFGAWRTAGFSIFAAAGCSCLLWCQNVRKFCTRISLASDRFWWWLNVKYCAVLLDWRGHWQFVKQTLPQPPITYSISDKNSGNTPVLWSLRHLTCCAHLK